jgi:hypothetical protein
LKELLSLKNEAWREEGESPLAAADFIKRMKLESISVLTNGDIEFWHDDGDLFWGHAIEVSGNLKKGLTRAVLQG